MVLTLILPAKLNPELDPNAIFAESAVAKTGVAAVAALTNLALPVPLTPSSFDAWKSTLPLVELMFTPVAAYTPNMLLAPLST